MDTNTIIHGDCIEVMQGFPDQSVSLIFSDLPYSCLEASWDQKIDLPTLFEQFNRVLKPNGTILLFASGKFTNALIRANEKQFRYKYIWIKRNKVGFPNIRHAPLRQFEEILCFYPDGKSHTYNVDHLLQPCKRPRIYAPDRNMGEGYTKPSLMHNHTQTLTGYPSDILIYPIDAGKKYHSSAKPIALLEHLIKIHSNPDDIVLDATAGCGSTLLATILTGEGRQYVGIEREQKYINSFYERLNELNIYINQD